MTVFGSARLPAEHPAFQQAVAFSHKIAEAGWMVITGAASGIMEAGHVGAGRERSIGVNILLPFEQQANPIIRGDLKLMNLRYFFTRKLLFIKEADAIALFPGGFGTQDEGFEALTLVQTGKSQLLPIVLVDEPGGDYWTQWERYIRDALLNRGADFANRHESVQGDRLGRGGGCRGAQLLSRLPQYAPRPPRLVLRLAHKLPEELLERLRQEFADVVVSGTFAQTEALPEEANDAHVGGVAAAALPLRPPQSRSAAPTVDLINREG